jgi:hypothetical protein
MFRCIKGLLIIAFLFTHVHLGAQNVSEVEIKTSGKYYWAESYSNDYETALDKALLGLSNKISVNITSVTDLQQRFTTNRNSSGSISGGSNTDINRSITTSSFLKLENIEFLKRQRAGQKSVLAYLEKADFQAQQKDVLSDLTVSYINFIDKLENTQTCKIINDLYTLYLDSFFYVGEPIADIGKGINLRKDLRGLITTYLSNSHLINSDIERSVSSDDKPYYRLKFKIDSESNSSCTTDNILLGFDLPEYGYQNGHQGDFMLNLIDFTPSSVEEIIPLKVSLDVPNNDERYQNLHNQVRPYITKTITINFINTIDIKINPLRVSDKAWKFQLLTSGINIRMVTWNFSGDKVITSAEPTRIFTNVDSVDISVTLNESDKLTHTIRFAPESGNYRLIHTNREFEKFKISESILRQLRDKKSEALLDQLKKLKLRQVLDYGDRSVCNSISDCYMLIVDSKYAFHTLLSPGDNSRYNIETGELIFEPMKKFKSYGVIWVNFLEQ